jgi:hypothetical protein
MAKNSKLLFTTFFLSMLLAASAYTTLVSNVNAAELTLQQKGETVLSDVVGVDLTKYTTVIAEHLQDAYLGVLPLSEMQYTLQSNESTLNIAYTFVNGNLQRIHVLEGKGSPITIKPSNTPVEMAKDFLNNFQGYTGRSLYGELEFMLNGIDIDESSTTVLGNVRLDATTSRDSATFRWTYAYNGIEAPVKCVALSYQNGFLKYFIDNWNLYKIGSTSINLSEEEATASGLASAKAFAWKVGCGNETCEVRDFNATQAMVWETLFGNSLSADTARGHDPLTLYPIRHVWVSLDKFYLGNVYGIEVFLWADTKDVYRIQERFTSYDPIYLEGSSKNENIASSNEPSPLDTTVQTVSSLISIPIGAFIGGICISQLVKKRNLLKSKTRKLVGLLLCLAVSSAVLLIPISTALATNKGVFIWGSRSSGGYDPDLPGIWRKTGNELGNQSDTSEEIAEVFVNRGYDVYNYQGSGSLKANILDNITFSRNNYPASVVVDFDHGVGNNYPNSSFHYMFEDDTGTMIGNHTIAGDPPNHPENGVYDYEIFSDTGGYSYQSKVFFAFINTCYSANLEKGQGQQTDGLPLGMPYAWTHRIVNWKGFENFTTSSHISMFGYEDGENGTDDGNYCYIGFPQGSAALALTSVQEGYTQTSYSSWMQNFFAYALVYDRSVKDALDDASQSCFQMDFGETDLYNNFTAKWPTWHGNETGWDNSSYTNCSLAVYGNGNIHIRPPELTVKAFDSNGSPVTGSVYIDGQYAGTTGNSFRVSIPASHTVQVISGSHTFRNFTGYSDFENPVSVSVYLDTTVTAKYYSNPRLNIR